MGPVHCLHGYVPEAVSVVLRTRPNARALLLLGTFLSLFPCRGHYGQAWDRPPEGGPRVQHVNREIVRS